MSFSANVKDELARNLEGARHCKIAEIAAIINMCGKISAKNNQVTIKIQTENAGVARKCFTILKKTFNIKVEVYTRRSKYLKRHIVYALYITDQEDAYKLLKTTRLIDEKDGVVIIKHRIHPLIVQGVCCKRAYIRGAFLASGSITDPAKAYHIEFVNIYKDHSEDLVYLINSFGMDAKIVARKKYFVVYLKEGTQIVDVLNIMQAHVALLELENLRIFKEMRNNINRMVNCETANLKKTVSAAVKQIEDIKLIEEVKGLHTLPEQLEEVARLRLKYNDYSLKEIGNNLYPPVGKSGVNHRFRKISEIAEEIRDSGGIV